MTFPGTVCKGAHMCFTCDILSECCSFKLSILFCSFYLKDQCVELSGIKLWDYRLQPSVTSRLTEREVETTVAAKKVENAKKVQFRADVCFLSSGLLYNGSFCKHNSESISM